MDVTVSYSYSDSDSIVLLTCVHLKKRFRASSFLLWGVMAPEPSPHVGSCHYGVDCISKNEEN